MLNLNIPVRTAQTFLAIVVLGINSYVTNWYVGHTTFAMAPKASILPIFVGAVSLLALPYLFFNAPLQITRSQRTANPRFFNKWVVLLLDSCLCVLWFIAWIYESVFRVTLTLCYGHICDLMVVSAVMGALASVAFFVTTILATLHVTRTRGRLSDLDSESPQAGEHKLESVETPPRRQSQRTSLDKEPVEQTKEVAEEEVSEPAPAEEHAHAHAHAHAEEESTIGQAR